MGIERSEFEDAHDRIVSNLMYLLAVTDLMKDRTKDLLLFANMEARKVEDIEGIYETIAAMKHKYVVVIDGMIEDCDDKKGSGTENKES